MRRHTSHFLLAADIALIEEHADAVEVLRRAGHKVRWAFTEGTPAPHTPMRGARRVHQLTADGLEPPRFSRLAPGRRMQQLANADPWFGRAVSNVTEMIALDRAAEAVLPLAAARGRDTVRRGRAADRIADLAVVARLGIALDAWGQAEAEPPAELVETATAALADAARRRDRPGVEAAVARLLARGPAKTRPVALIPVIEPIGEHSWPLLHAWMAAAELDRDGHTERDVVALAKQLLDRAATDLTDDADDARRADAVAEVVERTCLALNLVFHRELHSDGTFSAFAHDPDAYLAPLRECRIWRLLTGPNTPANSGPEPATTTGSRTGPRPGSVVVLPGPYPHFARPVISALEDDPTLSVRSLELGSADQQFRTMSMWPHAVEQRLLSAVGAPGEWGASTELKGHTVVFADWADKAAVWASLASESATALVVRVHSVDALRPWVHLIAWHRVSDVIVVSEHIRELVVEAVPALRSGVRIHVVPNVIPAPTPAADVDRDPYRLALLGWGQRVKDPLFALETLSLLRQRDPRWTLVLIGADFPPLKPASVERYAQRFRTRLLQDDVLEAVSFTGYVSDVAPVLQGSSVILSTSVRESQPVGLSEGMLCGALPAVRRWPQFAQRRATDRMFPQSWLFDTPEEAADLIAASLDPQGRRSWQDEAQQWLHEHLDAEAIGARYRSIVRRAAGVEAAGSAGASAVDFDA